MKASPRDDIALIEGYHSPQLDVEVRLNTNESPYPPPDAWRRELAAEVERIQWNRYPDREGRALREAVAAFHGVDPASILCANGSNEALQALCLAFGGAGRRALSFEPSYALHSWISRITGTELVEAERGEDFSLAPDDARRALDDAQPDLVFLCSPNNPTGLVEREDTVRTASDWCAAHEAVLVVDEAYAEFAPWSALGSVAEDRALVVTRTFSKTWSMAAARLGYLIGPPWLVDELEKVLLPYHLSAVIQAAGRLALRWSDEMHARVTSLVSERERIEAGLAELPVDVWPSGANFVLFRPTARSGPDVWQALVDRSVLVRDCSSWPRLENCLRVTVGTPEENDRFLSALGETARPMSRAAQKSRTTKETTIDLRLDVDGAGDVEATTGLPFFDHMLAQLGRHGGFDLAVSADGDLDIDAHHTVEDVGITLGGALAEALGDKAGVRRFASAAVPLDEALVDVALDLSGRPFLHYEVDPPGEKILGDPPFDPQLMEEFWRAFATAGNLTLHIVLVRGRNTHHIIESSVKSVARALRDAVRVEGTGIPSTKGTL